MLNFGYFLKSVIRSWKHQFAMQLASLLVLSSALTVVFSFYLVFTNMERLMVSWGSDLEMNVYLEEDLSEKDQESVLKSLQGMEKFKSIQFVDKKTTTETFFRKMSKYVPEFKQDDEFLSMVPSSYLVKMADYVKIDELPSLASEVMDVNGIEDVSYGQEWVSNFSVFVKAIHKTGWTIILILLMGSLFVIGYSVKATVTQRKEEIEVMELVGATSSMIRAPFVFEGMVMGLLSAIVAIVGSFLLYKLQDRLLVSEISLWGISDIFEFYKFYQMLILICVGALLGGATAYFCVKKINTGWAAINEKF